MSEINNGEEPLFLVADKYGREKEIRPSSQHEKPDQKEKPVGQMSFRELNAMVVNNRITFAELRNGGILDEIENRVDEARGLGYFDGIIDDAVEVANDSTSVTQFTDNMTHAANRYEESHQNVEDFDHDRYDGLVVAVVEGWNAQVRLDRATANTEAKRETLKRMREHAERVNHMPHEQNLYEMIIDNPHYEEDLEREALRRRAEEAERQAQAAIEAAQRMGQVDRGDFASLGFERMDYEEQLRRARTELEKIENGKQFWQRDPNLSRAVIRLESEYDVMDDRVRKEVRARLSIHTTSLLMEQANGFIENPPGRHTHTVGVAIEIAKQVGHLVDAETIQFTLKETEHGLGTQSAWDFWATVNSPKHYLGFLDACNIEYDRDNPPTNFFCDKDRRRRDQVESIIHGSLVAQDGLDEHTANKAMDLTWNLAIASGETSHWNSELLPVDQLAETIYVDTYRNNKADKDEKPKAGLDLHRDHIVQIGDTWLRAKTNGLDFDDPMTANTINPNKLENGGSLDAHYSTAVPRYRQLLERVTTLELKPGEVTSTHLAGVYKLIKESYKVRRRPGCEVNPIEPWYAAQVVELALTDLTLGFEPMHIDAMLSALQTELNSEGKPFVTKEQYNWILKAIDYEKKYRAYEAARTAQVRRGRQSKWNL